MKEMKDLRKMRVEAGLSQTELAHAVKVSQYSISRIERGIRRPKVETAKKIAHVLDFDWTDFYKEESDEQLQAKENVERQSTAET